MKPYIETASACGLEWVKSSYSGNNGNCVEVAALPGGGRALRDSKNPSGPMLTFSAEEFGAFVAGARAGEFGQA
ncbi:DUF397 domain-containing protein [Streptomyces dysideae]|uniref:DUF397 domain-containing protein n=1 Tax=Streptomyces dysideae TaxID=909626 RepID=A0A124IEI4_9ACTN|nr:DUF397 domain-containing protein [Streptomyces dysideae]KUO18397.1 hypothetical protein AQJ91_25510 [Streptomyces dysideae]